MKTEYAKTVCSYDALLRFAVLHAQNQGLDEIRITIPRAKEMLRDLEILKKSIEVQKPAYFNRLDEIFEQQAAALNRAYSEIVK